MQEETRDVIVVGAGHNGLAAAGYLAAEGLDVLVVEASPMIGGMTNTVSPIAEAPDHKMNLCAVDVVFMRGNTIRKDLELDRHGYRELEVDPGYVYLHPDGTSLALWRDPRKTAEEIRYFSRADADAFLDLARDLDAIIDVGGPYLDADACRPGIGTLARVTGRAVRQARRLPAITALSLSSGADVLRERFESVVVRNALAQLATTASGPLDTDGSALSLMFLAFVHRWGVGRPVGGTQAIPDAMAASLRKRGGTIRTSAAVERILVTDGSVTGVHLVGGDQIHARHGLVTTVDPTRTLNELLPPNTLTPRLKARVDGIPTAAFGACPAKVDIALRGRLTLERFERWRGDGLDLRLPSGLIGGLEPILHSFPQAAAGRIPDDIHLFTVVPTAVDPSQAPEGQETLYIYAPAMPRKPTTSWSAEADTMGKSVVAVASAYYDGIEELELGRFVETPEEVAVRLGATHGAPPFHVDFAATRIGPMRPALGLGGSRGPVDKLYLGGAGSHPGPGINGVPGKLAARALLSTTRARQVDRPRSHPTRVD